MIATAKVAWLTPPGVEQYHPAWSPDGARLVYGQSGANALFVGDSDGSNAHQITSCSLPCTQDVEPSWSTDGTGIAFDRNLRGSQQVFVVPSSGGPARQITNGPDDHASPSW